MALQKERGVNPLAGCLPILPQIPVFIALFHVLRRLAPGAEGLYSWSDELTEQAASAKLFGAPISASFNMDGAKERPCWRSRRHLHQHPHRLLRADRGHVRDDLLHAEADHEALRPGRGPGRHGAEAAALRHAAQPVRLRLLLPDRRPPLLVHEQPVDPGPAVLHPAQDAAARVAGRAGQGRRRQAGDRPAHAGAQARRQAGPPEGRPARHRRRRDAPSTADRRRRPTAARRRCRRLPAGRPRPAAPTARPVRASNARPGGRRAGAAGRAGPANRGKRKRR